MFFKERVKNEINPKEVIQMRGPSALLASQWSERGSGGRLLEGGEGRMGSTKAGARCLSVCPGRRFHPLPEPGGGRNSKVEAGKKNKVLK